MRIAEQSLHAIEALQKLQDTFERQRGSFRQCAPLGLGNRLEALDLLLQSVIHHKDAIIDAVAADFGQRSARETRLLELFPLVDEIRYVKRNLRRWMRPRSASANWQFLPSRTKIIYQPLGVVGVIGPWNYPVLLTLSPLVNAIAAGNHVLVKPSERARGSAEVVRQIVSKVFPEEYVAVVMGGPEIASAFSALPFDHILYTGSERVGKLVMKAAAENLTPVTLELGGKSPALVHESYPMSTAADRICSAKFWNAGQTCIAPDYVLVSSSRVDDFVRECETVVAKRYPRAASNADYTHLISESACEQMRDLVDDARSRGARVLQLDATQSDIPAGSRFFPPTLILDANDSMRVMQAEIFGPILPIVTYSSIEDALSFINARPRPLAFYYFDRNKSRVRKVLDQTVAGGATINDCIFHFVQHQLPFGGAGPSGMGAYHGFEGFCAFSQKKGVLFQNSLVGSLLSLALKPPYTSRSDRAISFLVGQSKARPIRRMTLPVKWNHATSSMKGRASGPGPCADYDENASGAPRF
ncbi:MAG TPA: coniferyl aldehyde dehydrogenase [Terracidiphilus sp.]|nr:coniferyl aldehyde dehydrogenase [Terracidiphilus sp.]